MKDTIPQGREHAILYGLLRERESRDPQDSLNSSLLFYLYFILLYSLILLYIHYSLYYYQFIKD